MSNDETSRDQADRAGDSEPKSTGRAGRSWLAAFALLLTIAVAGVAIYLNLPERAIEATAPSADRAKADATRPGPEAEERGMIASRLALVRLGEGGASGSLVTLARPSGPSRFDEILRTDPGILLRELIRQSLLMAARDELSVPTRDEVLDDVAPAEAGGEELEIASVFRADGPSRILIRRAGGKGAPIFERKLGPVSNESGTIAMVLPVAEELSRIGFPETIKKLGFSGNPNKWKAEGPLPPGLEKRLEGLSLFDHFAAIRELHDVVRDDGESPERLGALARAYAQLGVLTEFQWHPAHKVYKARALLYAERLSAREPDSSRALQYRAFVKSVIGLHREALNDLAEASKRAIKGGGMPPPAWVEPIEAYARNEVSRLAQMGGPHVKLARLLRMLAVEYPLVTDDSLRAAQDVVTLDVECYRAHDAMCRIGGVSNLHAATQLGPIVFTKLLPSKLGAIGSLPTAVKLALEQDRGELSVVESLDRAGQSAEDRGEPSWGALAHLIRETRFMQINRRLVFMKTIWCVPVEEYWAETRPFVAEHRYVTFLDSYAVPLREIRPALVEFANEIDLNELEGHEPELFTATDKYQTARARGEDAKFAMAHGDAVARDLASSVETPDPKYQAMQAKILLSVSPDSKLAQSLLVAHAWEEFKGQAHAWEEKAADSPLLLEALASRCRQMRQFDRAKTLLRRCVAISPQHSFYKELAAIYQQEGDMEGWRKALEDYLDNGEDKGLDHASTRVEIARYYMGQKRWKEATPYAEAAAQTWAEWAMICAMECREASGDWKEAEEWSKRVSERYPQESWWRWYCFCKRTGHGDLDSAKDWTEAFLDASKGRPGLADPRSVGFYYWLSGSPKRAFDTFHALYVANPNFKFGLPMLLVADEVGDKKLRDEILDEMHFKWKSQSPQVIEICERMREAVVGNKPLDMKAVEAIIASIPPESRGNAEFLVGKFLMNRKQSDLGRQHLRKVLEVPTTFAWFQAIANANLETEKR